MNCKHCGAELVEGKPFCPSCGKSQEETASPETQEGAKATPGKIALAVAAVVVVLALLMAVVIGGMDSPIFGGAGETLPPTEAATEPEQTVPATVPADGNPDDETCKGTYTVTDQEAYDAANTVVATVGGKELTNGLLQVLYWEEVYAFLQEYGSYATYFGLDYTRPLDTQICEDIETPMTWQQYFLKCALNTWHSYQSVALEGASKEFVMDDETRAYLDGLEAELTNLATEDSYESVEDFITTLVGAGPSLQDYVRYIEVYYEANSYLNHVFDTFQPTAEEVAAYFEENEPTYDENGINKDSGIYVDVRHILIMPEGGETGEDGYPVYTEEAWAAAKEIVDQIYADWEAGEHTEERFGELAKEHSEDGSASNGGLYTGVAQGDMVENFNDWCFDEARQVGDYGLVQTQFGYHIMYFSGSQEIWFATAEADLINQTTSAVIPSAMEKYPIEIDYSAIKLGLLDLI